MNPREREQVKPTAATTKREREAGRGSATVNQDDLAGARAHTNQSAATPGKETRGGAFLLKRRATGHFCAGRVILGGRDGGLVDEDELVGALLGCEEGVELRAPRTNEPRRRRLVLARHLLLHVCCYF